MNYRVDFDGDSGVCMIRVVGTHKRPDESHALLRIAGDVAAKQACSRFLFDMRDAVVSGGSMGAYETAVDPERQGFSRLNRVAAVYAKISKDEAFMEDVAVNRGAAQFRIFDNIDLARAWLTADPESESEPTSE